MPNIYVSYQTVDFGFSSYYELHHITWNSIFQLLLWLLILYYIKSKQFHTIIRDNKTNIMLKTHNASCLFYYNILLNNMFVIAIFYNNLIYNAVTIYNTEIYNSVTIYFWHNTIHFIIQCIRNYTIFLTLCVLKIKKYPLTFNYFNKIWQKTNLKICDLNLS